MRSSLFSARGTSSSTRGLEKVGRRRGRPLAILLALAVAVPAALFTGSAIDSAGSQTISFAATEALGNPTETSITVNIVPAETVSMFFEYGTTSGNYTNQTPTLTAEANEAHEVDITGLQPNTRYFYRTRYIHPNAPGVTEARPEFSFHTARPEGEEFTFDIITDSHIGIPGGGIAATLGNAGVFNASTANIDADQPDFVLDLGDEYLLNDSTTQARADQVYLASRQFTDRFAHSSPLFVMGGNHENEEGWNLDDMPNSKGIHSIKARKEFIPTPVDQGPGGFYTGNTDPLARIGADPHSPARDNLRENYYEFTWGDALFVVLDPFQYTMQMAYNCGTAGEVCNDSTPNELGNQGDQWNWTLGEQQYFWLRDVLETSNAKFKFVFSHHVTGGMLDVGGGAGGVGYVRGGAAAANYFEWGGLDENDDYVFDTMRPGWGKPIHQLMLDEGVTGFYHGHDHVYALEECGAPATNGDLCEADDKIIYHEIPHPSVDGGTGFGLYSIADPFTVSVIENGGHLRVTVDPEAGANGEAFAEYVRGSTDGNPVNGSVSHTYTMEPRTGEQGPNEPPTITASPNPTSVEAGTTEVVNLTAADPNGDTLTTTITANPGFASIVGGELQLSPNAGHVAGSPHTVTVQVSDGEFTASVNVSVTVTAPVPNQPPTITANPNPVTIANGASAVVDINTNDLDGDPVTRSITAGPPWATLVSGELSLAPPVGAQVGSPYTVTVQASDGEDTASVNVTVNVTGPVDPPEGGTFGDFDGDGDTDRAVFRPTGGRWYINGIAGNTQWGVNGDKPVAADYDGDGDTEIAVFRPSSGRWYINGVAGSTQWGVNGDVPVPGDYDGDGDANIAVFRPSNGRWYVNGIAGSTPWGLNGDVAVPGDYDGDGDTDFAVFRPTNGRWYVNGIAGSVQFGANGDVPVAADWDGDGDTDRAAFRGAGGQWFVEGVAGSVQWGLNGDVAVPGDYDGDGTIDRAVWRPASGRWYVEGIAGNVQWGSTGDIPSPRPIGAP